MWQEQQQVPALIWSVGQKGKDTAGSSDSNKAHVKHHWTSAINYGGCLLSIQHANWQFWPWDVYPWQPFVNVSINESGPMWANNTKPLYIVNIAAVITTRVDGTGGWFSWIQIFNQKLSPHDWDFLKSYTEEKEKNRHMRWDWQCIRLFLYPKQCLLLLRISRRPIV